jgi:hypothetical protein
MQIIIGQTVGNDRFRHGLTAGTAHRARRPPDLDNEIEPLRHGQAAVIAIVIGSQLLGLHADRAIEADHFAIQIRVLDDLPH